MIHSALRMLSLCTLLLVPSALASPIGEDEGRPRILAKDALAHVGELVFVHGEVVAVKEIGRLTFLNFDDGKPPRFTLVLRSGERERFPDDLKSVYEGKKVRVRGIISTYAGRPQIGLSDPKQIEVIESIPDLPDTTETKRPDRNTIRLASYNILNLFDDDDCPYHGDETTSPKSRRQMELVARTLRDLDADVVALQEVESRGYLQRFVDVFLPDLGYEHVVHYEGNDVRGIDVCLISRYPIGPVVSNRHLTFPGADGGTMEFERDLLQVTVTPPDAESLEVWVLHLKSNYDGREYAEPVREAEARQVRKMVDEALARNKDARIAVCGDYNDTWESKTVQTIVGEGDKALKSFAHELPTEARVTYNKEPYRTMIDFILVTPALAKDYQEGSYTIRQGTVESSGSDHNPVMATFKR